MAIILALKSVDGKKLVNVYTDDKRSEAEQKIIHDLLHFYHLHTAFGPIASADGKSFTFELSEVVYRPVRKPFNTVYEGLLSLEERFTKDVKDVASEKEVHTKIDHSIDDEIAELEKSKPVVKEVKLASASAKIEIYASALDAETIKIMLLAFNAAYPNLSPEFVITGNKLGLSSMKKIIQSSEAELKAEGKKIPTATIKYEPETPHLERTPSFFPEKKEESKAPTVSPPPTPRKK